MSALSVLFGILLFATSLFLILLVLVQRGRGGGLSGALGGMGGQSAFGTKAGDLFTRITIVAATVWILLCITSILVLNRQTTAQAPPDSDGFTTLQSDDSGETGESPETSGASGAGAGTPEVPPAE